MKKTILLVIPVLTGLLTFAQTELDSSKIMDEVFIRSFEHNRQIRNSASIVKVISFNNADRYNKTSIVNGMNSIAGVRMEERSPGSYRINMRGSSLRSPFGVRNVKVYFNDIPLTDAGGNTYFNQLAYNNFSHIELFKGPAGSLYGAGTGGLIMLYGMGQWQPGASIEYVTGSYDLQNIFASARFGNANARNQFTYAHNQSDGYRIQSAMRRDNITWQSVLSSGGKNQLSVSLLFTDMYYQTPGALTLTEYNSNPKLARPAGGGFPSAQNAKAAIFQKNLLAGFTNEYTICTDWKNTTTVYGAFNEIKNPAIRNYERRIEPGFGGRTHFSWEKHDRISGMSANNNYKIVAGAEFNQGYFNTQVSKNKNGLPDTLQTNDDTRYTNYSLFLQSDITLGEKWLLLAGISMNKTEVIFRRLNKYPVIRQESHYNNEFAPRISLKRKFENDNYISGTVSRGFSPPTIAELLPSTGVIGTDLEAEFGWNYEITGRINLLHKKLSLEACGFYFRLDKALVQRRDISGADYFVNAGDIKQKGLEITANYLHSWNSKTVEYFNIQVAETINDFHYGEFKKGTDDFSGKRVPSVPENTLSVMSDVQFRFGLYTNLTWYSSSKIFLNDANTAAASLYNLLGCRVGWRKLVARKYKLNFYIGGDNMLDEKYSLGNDINAPAGRFYNAAPRRNYYAGLGFQWIKTKQ